MESTINQRVKIIIDSLYGGNKRAFALSVGVSPTVIENIVGSRQGSPSFDITQKICANANIDANWFLTGDGVMLKDQQSMVQEDRSEYLLRTDSRKSHQQVPLYNIEAAGGFLKLVNDNQPSILSYISIPDMPRCDGAIFVRGDSMYPLLKSGDIVIYKEMHDLANGLIWGEMYVIAFTFDGDTYTTIKYIQRSDRGPEWVKLVSQNQHHHPMEIRLKDIQAVAIVKASIRYNTFN